LEQYLGEDFVYVTDREKISDVIKAFDKAKKVKTVVIPLYKDYAMVYHVYYLKHFKGYQ
jgi:hypothetical protein